MPHTRWWRWSPPSVVTLPGHHGTFGLRISRALVRMNRNDSRNDPNRTKPARWLRSSRKCAGNSKLIVRLRPAITGGTDLPLRNPYRGGSGQLPLVISHTGRRSVPRREGFLGARVADLRAERRIFAREMARPGIEPGTPRFSVVCSTN